MSDTPTIDSSAMVAGVLKWFQKHENRRMMDCEHMHLLHITPKRNDGKCIENLLLSRMGTMQRRKDMLLLLLLELTKRISLKINKLIRKGYKGLEA